MPGKGRYVLAALPDAPSGSTAHFRAVRAASLFDPESKKVVQQVLDSMILQQEARRWSAER